MYSSAKPFHILTSKDLLGDGLESRDKESDDEAEDDHRLRDGHQDDGTTHELGPLGDRHPHR